MVLAALVITLREGTEAALVIAAVFAYLKKVGRMDLNKYVYGGSALGIAASFALAGIYMGISEIAESFQDLFQAGTMFLAAAVLTYVLIWMTRHARRPRGAIEGIQTAMSKGQIATISVVAFTSVFREGVEAVLLVAAVAATTSAGDAVTGSLLGLASALVIGLSLVKGSYRVDVRTFFKYTSVLLLLIGAMVTAHGVEELQDAGVPLILGDQVYNLNPMLPPVLQEGGVVGSIVHAFIGIPFSPSIMSLLVQIGYLLVVGSILWRTYGYAVGSRVTGPTG